MSSSSTKLQLLGILLVLVAQYLSSIFFLGFITPWILLIGLIVGIVGVFK